MIQAGACGATVEARILTTQGAPIRSARALVLLVLPAGTATTKISDRSASLRPSSASGQPAWSTKKTNRGRRPRSSSKRSMAPSDETEGDPSLSFSPAPQGVTTGPAPSCRPSPPCRIAVARGSRAEDKVGLVKALGTGSQGQGSLPAGQVAHKFRVAPWPEPPGKVEFWTPCGPWRSKSCNTIVSRSCGRVLRFSPRPATGQTVRLHRL